MGADSEAKTQDLLDDMTRMLQRGEPVDALLEMTDEARGDVEGLLVIVRGLNEALKPVEPREEYASQLRAELLEDRSGLTERIRGMPARVHVAAILALIAGFCLLLSRRLFGSAAAQDISEEPMARAL